MKAERITLFLDANTVLDARRGGLFVIRREGPRPGGHTVGGLTKRDIKVLARGRIRDDGALMVSRSTLSLKTIREMVQKSGRNVKVVGAKRR